jgi:hypothetical protein
VHQEQTVAKQAADAAVIKSNIYLLNGIATIGIVVSLTCTICNSIRRRAAVNKSLKRFHFKKDK